jgi:hypothetical protein
MDLGLQKDLPAAFLTSAQSRSLIVIGTSERASITNEIFILPNVRIIGAGVGCRRVFAGARTAEWAPDIFSPEDKNGRRNRQIYRLHTA